ncbi:MAG: hypothetical protein JNK57_11295 [Planctomycetaceae bacterium]|nr:hypothetical protein [Planctomycetaceae bacterium]
MWQRLRANQVRSLVCWAIAFWISVGWDVNVAPADVLYFASELPPIAGRLIEETAETITFQVRLPNGSTRMETIPHSSVARIIRTINVATLENSQTSTNSDVLAYAEMLLAIHNDLEAQHCGQELLSELGKREALADEWKLAICRLQLQALPPGLARERSRRNWQKTGLDVPKPLETEESWQWYAVRLSKDVRAEWLRTIRADRAATEAIQANQTPVARTQIQQAILRMQATLVVGSPLHRWTTMLLAELARDDMAALITLTRLETVLSDEP